MFRSALLLLCLVTFSLAACSKAEPPALKAQMSSEAQSVIDSNPQTKQAYKFLDGKPSVVFYFANWCPHCVRMKPTMTELYDKYSKQINFIFVNVDQPDLQQMIQSLRPGGGGIPHFQFYDRETKMLGEMSGARPKVFLEQQIKSLL